MQGLWFGFARNTVQHTHRVTTCSRVGVSVVSLICAHPPSRRLTTTTASAAKPGGGRELVQIYSVLGGTGKCMGCGCRFQTQHPLAPGFINEEVLQKRIDLLSGHAISKPPSRKLNGIVDEEHTNPPEDETTKAHALDASKRLVCRWCFELAHQNKVLKPSINPAGVNECIQKVLGEADEDTNSKNRRCTVVLVVDITDTPASFSPGVVELVQNRRVLLVGNKIDLLPDDASTQHQNRLKEWLFRCAKAAGITNIRNVMFVSAQTGVGLKELQSIIKLDLGFRSKNTSITREVVLVGATNSGKSTLLKQLIPKLVSRNKGQLLQRMLGGKDANWDDLHQQPAKDTQPNENANNNTSNNNNNAEDDDGEVNPVSLAETQELIQSAKMLTTSSSPGTTQSALAFRMGRRSTLYDTPGVLPSNHISFILPSKDWKLARLSKRTKPSFISFSSGNSLLLGGMVRIDHVDGPDILLINFVSNTLPLHMTKTKHVQAKWEKHAGGLFSPPCGELALTLSKSWRVVDIPIDGGNKWGFSPVDIVLSGLGWIACTGKGTTTLRFHVPDCMRVETRISLLPFESKKYVKYKKIVNPKAAVGN